jgi:hypothetical protein
VFGAPRLQASLGIAKTMYANLAAFAVVVLVIAIWTTGLPALMDDSATRGLSRLARSNVLVVNPDAPAAVPAEDLWGELGQGLIPGGDHHGTPRSAPSWASSCCLRSTPPA